MKKPHLAACLVISTAIAGCAEEEPVAANPVVEAETPVVAPTVAPVAPALAPTPGAAVEIAPDTPIDTGLYAGTFAGGPVRVELHADGTYGMEGPAGPAAGSWAHEQEAGVIRLDPGSKTADDVVLRMDGADTLVMLDAQGQPLAGQAPLRRQSR